MSEGLAVARAVEIQVSARQIRPCEHGAVALPQFADRLAGQPEAALRSAWALPSSSRYFSARQSPAGAPHVRPGYRRAFPAVVSCALSPPKAQEAGLVGLVFRICVPQLYARLAAIREDDPTFQQRFADSLDSLWPDLLPVLKVDNRPPCQTRRCREFGLSHSE